MMLFFVALTVLMVLVMVLDATRYLIPNWLTGMVLGLYPLMLIMAPALPNLMHAGLVFVGALAVGIIIFQFGLMGGGDVKLLIACAPWCGWPKVVDFLIWTGLLGGALSVVVLVARKVLPWLAGNTVPRLFRAGEPVPYGLAIAGAFLILLWKQLLPGLVL